MKLSNGEEVGILPLEGVLKFLLKLLKKDDELIQSTNPKETKFYDINSNDFSYLMREKFQNKKLVGLKIFVDEVFCLKSIK